MKDNLINSGKTLFQKIPEALPAPSFTILLDTKNKLTTFIFSKYETPSMKKIIVIILVAFIIIQFFPIDKTNPAPTPGMDFLKIKNTPENIAHTLRTSCYDCHSNETKYPWYSSIAPTSWWVKNHIDEGRKHLNFSTFAVYEPKRQLHKLEECIEMVEKKEMPLESYYIGHQDAKLSDEQRADLVLYFKKIKEDTERKIMFSK